MIIINKKLILLLLLASLPLFGQINSNSINQFFQKQPCRIYYWYNINSPAYFGEDTLINTFTPIKIFSTTNDISTIKYEFLNSQIRLNNYETRYPEFDTTFFYYVPLSYGNIGEFKFYNADQSEIHFQQNNSPICKSEEKLTSVIKSINMFESDLKRYSELKHYNINFEKEVPLILVLSAVYGYLGYEGIRTRNAEGSKGTWNLIGGVISAGVTVANLIRTVVRFYNFLLNNSEINDITNRVYQNNY